MTAKLLAPPGRRLVLAATLALLAVMTTACGGGDDSGRDIERAATFTVTGTEMAFGAPERVAEGSYAITFKNAGTVYHEVAFRDPSGEFVARRSIAAGTTVTIEVDLTPGTWELGCFEPGHYEAGMYRALIVESG